MVPSRQALPQIGAVALKFGFRVSVGIVDLAADKL